MGPLLNLQSLAPHQVVQAAGHVRSLARGAHSRVEVAERIVSYLFEHCRDAGGMRSTVLVRCYQTCPYARLPVEYQVAADRMMGDLMHASGETRCLALLATRGKKLTWNDPATSTGHMAIPLPSVEVIVRAPMLARMVEALGVPTDEMVVLPRVPGLVRDVGVGAARMFCVEGAADSVHLPAQKAFVKPYDVRSVMGMGDVLADGECFVVVIFTSVPLQAGMAEMLAEMAPVVGQALQACDPVFGAGLPLYTYSG